MNSSFFFMVTAFCVLFKKYFSTKEIIYSYILSSKNFMVLPFTFVFLIYLELIFLYGMNGLAIMP